MEIKRCLLLLVAVVAASCASGSEAPDARIATGADARWSDAPALIDAPPGGADAGSSGDARVADGAVPGADGPSPLNIGLRIVEIYYDHTGTDDRFEWVKLYNGTSSSINLGNYAFGWGGADYTYGLMDLAGSIAPYDCFLVGGPMGNAVSGSPAFDLALDFSPDLQNSGTVGDGVALFNLPASGITAMSTPVHAVIYGPNNNSGLYDENGPTGNVDITAAPDESSLRMKADLTWEVNATPTPNACLPFP